MKIFFCDSCGSLVFFENVKCLKCGHTLGFLPALGDISALEAKDDGNWRALAAKAQPAYRACDNSRQYQVCNWMVSVEDPNPLCISCRLNDVVPNLSVSGNVERWHKLENAKRRVIYTILRLGLPTDGVAAEQRPALRFKFVADVPDEPPPLTGHDNGMITVNIAEADDAERERRRVSFHEPYRTLLGHLRHETAHYYWDRLIANSKWLDGFRNLFGDETADYEVALKKYYAEGAPANWQTRHVSAYASAHPWEDWAETWAHYFHIIDMVETAGSFGLKIKPNHPAVKTMTADLSRSEDVHMSFDAILKDWFPLTQALNSLNRGMGLLDAYPFVLSDPAIEKLRFIHGVAHGAGEKNEKGAGARGLAVQAG